ncbi:Carbamoyl-phosphate synthase large chain [anaerobic digester metagenome]
MKKYRKVLVLGSGALKIGEAGEFDYSGSQALKALREEGISTVLINPNIATVQTSEGVADKVYFLPVTPAFCEKVIEKERPDAIFLSFGGQTALNCGVALFDSGVLSRYNVDVLGTPVATIKNTEDRELFAGKLAEIGVKTPRSLAVHSVDEALEASKTIGFPIIVRAAYTLGGQGSGFCSNLEELRALAVNALTFSPQILVEESLKGWKEVDYEVVRDRFDNCITVCNMENFDPLGIHTGESIVVAPSQTLSNSEYHKLREISIRVIRHLGVVGECNIQYALDPESEDYRVIEVNARLSRSSALASKATGYPLAFIAAKLGLGYGLHQLKNSVTKVTSACFEPALDYVVVKIPRWDLGKFTGVNRELGSSMKSVGEVMAIGRSFEEAIQKGVRMVGEGMHGVVANSLKPISNLDEALSHPTDRRLFAVTQAFEEGYSVDRVHELTKIDRWFLVKLERIVALRQQLSENKDIDTISPEEMLTLKQAGFSDFQIARTILSPEPKEMAAATLSVRELRKEMGVLPVVKQVDTLAAEYPAQTSYLYLTYHGTQSDVCTIKNNPPVIVLGSGAYRIGSSVEFDWCSVSAVNAVRKQAIPAVVINFNPETVSTDYDTCDRLYFEELSLERVLDIVDMEQPRGVMVSVGGQIPNNLAIRLHGAGVKVLGTHPDSIDRAEDRGKFSAMLDTLGIDQPRWRSLTSFDDVEQFAQEVGFPLLIRPSYVLSGSAMSVVSNNAELRHFLSVATQVSKTHPVVVTEFIEGAKEIEYDAVANNGEIMMDAISEHVEFAGVHSGDATLVFPAQKLYFETIRRIRRIAQKIAAELNIVSPFNMQLLARDNDVMVIECNLRASRSFPFVSKVLGYNYIEAATLYMLGRSPLTLPKSGFDLNHVGVKASQFSFQRLTKADPIVGVEMASTGEVGCISTDFDDALLKAMLSVGYRIPQQSVLVSSGPIRSKLALLAPLHELNLRGFTIYATKGTAKFLNENGIPAISVAWPDEVNDEPNCITLIKERKVDMVINIPKNLSQKELDNDYTIRRTAIDYNIPLVTNARLGAAFLTATGRKSVESLEIRDWASYLTGF